MSRLFVTTWFWGTKYDKEDVRKLFDGVARHLHQPYEPVIVCQHPYEAWGVQGLKWAEMYYSDMYLTMIPGCFARLRMFDPEWQKINGIEPDDRILNLDLDSVVISELDPLVCRAETFMILQGANASNPCPFNGSVMMLRAGHHADLWSDFTLDKTLMIQKWEFADDQGWIHTKLPNAPGWKVGSPSGIYAFQKPGWPKGNDLPSDARLVVFPGWRSPAKFAQLPWVKEHWV